MQSQDEDDKQKHPPMPISPAMRIYRHALEAIFELLNLQDLIPILAVSRDWSAAVKCMRPVNASIARDEWRSIFEKKVFRPVFPNASLVASPLLRHLAALHITHAHSGVVWTELDNASLAVLAQHAPNLRSLWCKLALRPNEPLILPAKLQSLQLQLDHTHTVPEINDVLTALVALPLLSRLCLRASAFEDESDVELSRLEACPSLSELAIANLRGSAPMLSGPQVKQIRSSLGHLQRINVGWMDSGLLARFLLPPVTARWRDIGFVEADVRTGELLLRLPSLTKLDLGLCSDDGGTCVDLLPQLLQLTSLKLDCNKDGAWAVSADALLASLARCTGLSELDLSCGFNSAHWSALFAKLTKITKLTIRRGDLESLQCFAAGPITHSLEELTLSGTELPPSEFPHLYGLRRLRVLHLESCFSALMDDDTIQSFSPPTPRMPALTKWSHRGCTADDKRFFVERQGPSFEWMQQRLTQ